MNISKSVQPDTTHHEPATTRRVREAFLKVSHLSLSAITLLMIIVLVLANLIEKVDN
ncbi:MAG: hypothetical protein WD061_02405 [Candidatus Saccharimonadales bacterium]